MVKYFFLKGIRFYQAFLSPVKMLFFGLAGEESTCRFYPSCSEYCYLAIEKYGIFQGMWKCLRRISRCHPWNPGGVDFP